MKQPMTRPEFALWLILSAVFYFGADCAVLYHGRDVVMHAFYSGVGTAIFIVAVWQRSADKRRGA